MHTAKVIAIVFLNTPFMSSSIWCGSGISENNPPQIDGFRDTLGGPSVDGLSVRIGLNELTDSARFLKLSLKIALPTMGHTDGRVKVHVPEVPVRVLCQIS